MENQQKETINVTWRGETFTLTPHSVSGYRLPFAERYRSVLWRPNDQIGFRKDLWIADAVLPGTKGFDVYGATPQEAIDALAAFIAEHELSPGGSC